MEPHEKIKAFVKAYDEAAKASYGIYVGTELEMFLQTEVWNKLEGEITVEPVDNPPPNLGQFRLRKRIGENATAYTYANGPKKAGEAQELKEAA